MPFFAASEAPPRPESMKFPVNSLLAGNLAFSETSSQLTPPSRRESITNLTPADAERPQKLSPLIDRINDRYGRCAIGFGLFPADVRAFKGHAAFHRVPETWEFLSSLPAG